MADLPVPSTSADQVRRVTEEVLSRPEFAGAAPRWWERILEAVLEFFARLFAAIGAGNRGSIIGTVVLVAVVLAAAAAALRFGRSIRGDAAVPVAVDLQIGRSARDWRSEAQEHERAGRWREAVRCRYRALLADLAGAGLVDEVAGRTSGEYRAAVASDVPAAAAAFDRATAVFDLAWYSHEPVSALDAEALQEAADRALHDAGVRVPAKAQR